MLITLQHINTHTCALFHLWFIPPRKRSSFKVFVLIFPFFFFLCLPKERSQRFTSLDIAKKKKKKLIRIISARQSRKLSVREASVINSKTNIFYSLFHRCFLFLLFFFLLLPSLRNVFSMILYKKKNLCRYLQKKEKKNLGRKI